MGDKADITENFNEEDFNNAIEEIMVIDPEEEYVEYYQYYELHNSDLENIIKMCKTMHQKGYTPPFGLLIDGQGFIHNELWDLYCQSPNDGLNYALASALIDNDLEKMRESLLNGADPDCYLSEMIKPDDGKIGYIPNSDAGLGLYITNTEQLKLLVEHGGNVDFLFKDFCVGLVENALEVLECYKSLGANIEQLGGRLLHYTLHPSRKREMKFLIENNVDINTQDDDGETPLITAICSGDRENVEYLCRAGASIKPHEKWGTIFDPIKIAEHYVSGNPSDEVYSDILQILKTKEASAKLEQVRNKINNHDISVIDATKTEDKQTVEVSSKHRERAKNQTEFSKAIMQAKRASEGK